MSTPILTTTQLKQSLSAKKKLKKVTVRNILASPYTNYWPMVKPEDALTLNQVLKQNLLKIKPVKVKVPWENLKGVPQKERKDFRFQYNKDLEPANKTYRLYLAFGINETAKLLEAKNASSILLSAHVDPRFMVKHILDMAVVQNTPVLIVPNLNSILKEHTGIASIALAFKINPDMVPNYKAIDEKVKEIAADYPPPLNHINFHRRDILLNGDDTTEITCTNNPKNVIESDDEIEQKDHKNFYLYRKSKTERSFIPEKSKYQITTDVTKMEVDDSGYLPLEETKGKKPVIKECEIDLNQKSKIKTKVSYKSLVIKRITNNKNREQKKIELLKRKK